MAKKEQPVPAAEAKARLQKYSKGKLYTGIVEGLLRLNEGQNVAESDLKLFETAYRDFGPEKTNSLLTTLFHTTALKQANKFRLRKKISVNGADARLFVTRHFLPKMLKIISSKKLNRHYRLVNYGYEATDKPFTNSLRIFGKSVGQVCSFNYDLFFGKKGKPCVVLGSIQHFGSKPSQEFKKRMGQYPLNFFITLFKRTFPSKNTVLVLNVRHHPYRKRKLKEHANIVAASMVIKKELSEEDFKLWNDYHIFGEQLFLRRSEPTNELIEKIQKTEEAIKRKMKEVETFDTGLHKSAYKNAGFRLTRSRFWRLKKK